MGEHIHLLNHRRLSILAENSDCLDHGWVPFAKVSARESYDVDIPFYVNPDEIVEYLIGATEAAYVE